MLNKQQIDSIKPNERVTRWKDCHHLYLEVEPSGKKHWLFCYEDRQKFIRVQLGEYPFVTTVRARQISRACKTLLEAGLAPTNKPPAPALHQTSDSCDSFRSIALQWHDFKRKSWNSKHADKVLSRLEQRVFPILGDLSVTDIRTPSIIKLLLDIEHASSSEVAKRAHLYITDIFKFACQFEYCDKNPAREAQGIVKPKNNKFAAFKPHQLPRYFKKLRNYEQRAYPVTVLALRFIMHTFVRNSEMRLAKWAEIDWKERLWEIPGERMKMKKPHVVPLTKQSLSILSELKAISGDLEHIFPMKNKPYKSISDVSCNQALKKMGIDTRNEHTTHGFRTVASSILNESGLWNPDAIERQLAHEERNDVRAAYNRAIYLDERIKMMDWYSDYLSKVEIGHVKPTKIRFDGVRSN